MNPVEALAKLTRGGGDHIEFRIGLLRKNDAGAMTSVELSGPLKQIEVKRIRRPSAQFALQFAIAFSGHSSVAGMHQPDGFRLERTALGAS
jgi:hypothetical protein